MTKHALRISQLISTFGPGSMLDLPTRSVLVNGLEQWDMRGNAFSTISEPRLVELLEERLKQSGRLDPEQSLTLRTPPVANDLSFGIPPGVQATIFPRWFVCEEVETEQRNGREHRKRQLVQWANLLPSGGKRRVQLESGKISDVIPIRFVGACEDGHLQDIDWRWVVHKSQACQEPMWLEELGTSADPADTTITCKCGKTLSMQQAFAKGVLGKCQGERPWLGVGAHEQCQHDLRFLTRTATNAYFPQVATVISLPVGEDELTRLVVGLLADLADAASIEDIAMARRFNPKVKATLEGYNDLDVLGRLEQIRATTKADVKLPPKYAEFDVLASGKALIGENATHARLHAETLSREAWAQDVGIDLGVVQNLVAVHRLREVSCLYGFTRFEAAPTATDGDLEDVQLAVSGARISLDADWLPAIEQFGEGLFIHFDAARIRQWSGEETVRHRVDELLAGYDAWGAKMGGKRPRFPGLTYYLLHSLSHALLAEIAMECGYPMTALKERIYALPDFTDPSRIGRCAILIYTATAGTQGTLGGLVAMTARFAEILKAACDRLAICSNDPICADHEPKSSTDDRALHGAACHGCLLVPETSCESRNVYLDRALLVDTISNSTAFFR